MSLAHLFSGKDTVKTQRSNVQSSMLDLVLDLFEDAGAETGSSLMLTTDFQCLKGRSVETGFVCSFVSTLQPLCGGTVCLSPLIKPVIHSSGPT